MNTTLIILAALVVLYFGVKFFLKKKKAGDILDDEPIKKVKAKTYILCPKCGARLELDAKE